MNPLLRESAEAQGYDGLPEAIKSIYTPREYAWLSDAEKATLIERETEPETD